MIALATVAAALSACDFGAPAPGAPKELQEYAFLVGEHRIEARSWNPETNAWRDQHLETRWTGRWALGGHAVYDEWTDPQPPDAKTAPGLGANFRMWNPKTHQWSNMWMHTGETQTTDILSEMRDGKMVMWQVYPKPDLEWKAEFEVRDDGSWTRIHYLMGADGRFSPRFRLDAYKLPCEANSP